MRRPSATILLLAAVTVGGGCTRGDDVAGPEPSGDASTIATDPSTSSVVAGTDRASGAGSATDAAPGPTVEPTTTAGTFEVVDVPESGVPGIDSADAFCAAWSRFGGSWQVIQVAATFAPDPSVVPAMEVAASPVVVAAYDAMFDAWPEELAEERERVADGFFGPLRRRAEIALTELGTAGAAVDDLESIGDAWVAALAARSLDDPVVTPELTDAESALVEAAAASFDSSLVGIADDPTMRIVTPTPLTDQYLATACPDQGALLGGEVGGD